MAERALYIDSLLELVRHMGDVAPTRLQGALGDRAVPDGILFRDDFLSLAHGERGLLVSIASSVADLSAFRRSADDWEAGALRLMKPARDLDPEWFHAWGGTSKRARLERSNAAGDVLDEVDLDEVDLSDLSAYRWAVGPLNENPLLPRDDVEYDDTAHLFEPGEDQLWRKACTGSPWTAESLRTVTTSDAKCKHCKDAADSATTPPTPW
jgi:hypothetical protein